MGELRETSSDLAAVEASLGHAFADAALLELALTHPSYSQERGEGRGNERLEFLGDSVLDLVFGLLLFERWPDWTEGHLTRARATFVNTEALAAHTRRLDLGRHVRLGRSERRTDGEEKDSILANLFEALIGALYLDAGLDPVFALARREFADDLEQAERALRRDSKTELNEWAHATGRATPVYRVVGHSAVDDDPERFQVEVEVGSDVVGGGTGRNKRIAEQAAARAALAQGRELDGVGAREADPT